MTLEFSDVPLRDVQRRWRSLCKDGANAQQLVTQLREALWLAGCGAVELRHFSMPTAPDGACGISCACFISDVQEIKNALTALTARETEEYINAANAIYAAAERNTMDHVPPAILKIVEAIQAGGRDPGLLDALHDALCEHGFTSIAKVHFEGDADYPPCGFSCLFLSRLDDARKPFGPARLAHWEATSATTQEFRAIWKQQQATKAVFKQVQAQTPSKPGGPTKAKK